MMFSNIFKLCISDTLQKKTNHLKITIRMKPLYGILRIRDWGKEMKSSYRDRQGKGDENKGTHKENE